jgi:alkylhydroperoxidase/carboxymuconolactone decarboxylase family protein YurZ
MQAFSALAQASTRDGALDRKTKELIALALGVDGQAVVCPLLRGSSPTRGVAPKQHRAPALTPFITLYAREGAAARCDGCIGFHAEALVKLGATYQEVEETLGMAVYMGGGPSLMYAADAISAYEQFQKQLNVAA